ncbi:uncharacterized protein BP01DRAFT_301232 [Aspergillus saccharolyticus JOP 1030-1]|uniref:Uncharacterized protein n=1 Tax=Aspergillus saccharolyticus JOP 1030-1 TaxID=1450539 RepID=A0A318Z885_9EURO|nr:hypothetical protein BP01DRAFT_301232 [Aspergillus saccharolyticus JOP 1030-1]PYH43359.1 hypothetical protein BP01DRAFT_301232 [Aspergillus saccharolyticus JOP 1030-1]
MARLYIPGLPFRKDPVPTASRIKSQPAFRSFPYHPSVIFRPNVPLPATRPCFSSHVPVFSPKSAVRSFQEMRKGSNLPVRSQVRTTSTPKPPVVGTTVVQDQLKETLSRLHERRAARQARSRPWAQARSTTKPPLPQRPAPTPTSATHVRMTAREMVAKIDAILAKYAAPRARVPRVPVSCVPVVRKDKSKKRVRFCETTEVLTVPRWIERKEHVFPGPLSCLGHLQGWKVTPLREPDEDGEMEKYTTYWGSDTYVCLSYHNANSPCNRYMCAWNSLARIQAKRPAWQPPMVFSGWLKMREKLREQGEFRL